MRKVFTNLTFWVLLAIAAGILVGHFAPAFALQPVLHKDYKLVFPGHELVFYSSLSQFISSISSTPSNCLSTRLFS